MKSMRVQAIVLATAAVAGYGGAAAFSALALPPLAEGTDFGPGDGLTRIVLTANAGAFDSALLERLESVDGVVSAQGLHGGRALVATEGMAPQHLETVSGVADAEFSVSVPVLGTISDPYYPQYGWNLENTGANHHNQPVAGVPDADMDATDGWGVGTGAGRIVAVVDSGFDSDHPDLQGALWTNPDETCGSVDRDRNGLAGDCHGWNFYTNTADVDNGTMGSHGASVSGVVGARAGNGVGSAGVAPGVSIMPLVIGGGSTVDVNLGAQAIRYAVDHGADVINASWGGAFSGWPLANLQDAVAYAAAHDVLVVAAAGNDAANRDTSILYPASLPDANVVTVGSSTAGDTVSPSSAYGAAAVDLFAPGYLVATTWNDGGTRLVSGTSIAAPHVAAAYALYRAQRPDAGYTELKQALLDDVDTLPAFTGRSVTGGRLTMSRLTGSSSESVTYAFTSMTSPAGVVSPAIGVTGPTTPGDYEVAFGLGMEHDGEIWALADKAVTLGGTTVTTDDTGEAVFVLGTRSWLDGTGLAPTMALGDGRYVLTVQTYRDGAPVGRAYSAPLLVGSAVPAPGDSTPDGTSPGDSTPGTSTPGTSTPSTPTPSTPTPGTPTPSTPAPGGSTPGGGSPGGTTLPATGTITMPRSSTPSGPGTSTPGDGSTPGGSTPGERAPSTPGGSTPDGSMPGGSTPGSSTPDTTAPGGSTPGGSAPGGSTPDGSTPRTTAPGTPDPQGPVPGTTTYPRVGVFSITSLSPNVVDVAGGTTVTITGLALPAGPTVRVGATARATVVSATTTRLTFRVPARVAGVYDVWVFAPDGRSTQLSDALTYAAAIGGTEPGDDGAGSPPDGSTPESPTPGTTPGGPTPDGSSPGGPTPGGTAPGGATPESPASGATPVVRSGPAGERLVRSARFAGLRAIWSLDCSSSCTGVAI
jgi:serine protease